MHLGVLYALCMAIEFVLLAVQGFKLRQPLATWIVSIPEKESRRLSVDDYLQPLHIFEQALWAAARLSSQEPVSSGVCVSL